MIIWPVNKGLKQKNNTLNVFVDCSWLNDLMGCIVLYPRYGLQWSAAHDIYMASIFFDYDNLYNLMKS